MDCRRRCNDIFITSHLSSGPVEKLSHHFYSAAAIAMVVVMMMMMMPKEEEGQAGEEEDVNVETRIRENGIKYLLQSISLGVRWFAFAYSLP